MEDLKEAPSGSNPALVHMNRYKSVSKSECILSVQIEPTDVELRNVT